ncbi:hypothetical protein AJ85_20885 [Alkalihalobacillus alcalophilus ATCC 27647 = CGMCC 1.3604]|uniref:Uncharacterized protein n=1 Tax=Alkalihalobacillus alcalophilus ATCC 27647 = CGMCC 1.3604 TaxID=1218173 RepID=A0A094WJ23_ALKAL|nr:hypothetical protein [Alkalihalobacillus alcalophilus]KGA96826.1 hypothetical protein BALCAV_0213905 [Alkalihalobacillus alcalophilus ATCC 27647 = CGMCC 1.3604]MED1561215.1 hypothetical protein [Alkalihalobacillus alcalophilus]THG88856.1 hypothetical protein AJ85_20885 [Alkalihalobacillus alcalophilus ATCC 27647 = CGMCC 1.3604]
MLEGNKALYILPGILIVLMIVGGMFFLNDNEGVTNEELIDEIELNVEIHQSDESVKVRAHWDWTVAPADGLNGDDYLGMVFYNESGEVVEDFSVVESELQLFHSDEVIEQSHAIEGENGLIFTFTNQLDEHISYGNLGEAVVTIESDEVVFAEVFLLHTWVNHSPLVSADATFEMVEFERGSGIPYWVLNVSTGE